MALHATLSPRQPSHITDEAAARGRAVVNSKMLTCGECGHSTTAGPMALHKCDPSCAAVHHRIIRRKGRASTHRCTDCGQQAYDWSYGYQDPNERVDPEGQYSLDPEHYTPRCRKCHIRHDIKHGARS